MKTKRTYERLDHKCYKETTKRYLFGFVLISINEEIYEYEDVYSMNWKQGD